MNRLTEARALGSVLLIGAPGQDTDVRYASGFHAVDPMVFLAHRGQHYLVVPLLEMGRARNEAPRATVFTPQDLGLSPQDRRRIAAWTLGLLRRLRIARVTVPSSFPSGLMRCIEQAGIVVEISKHALFPQRDIKTERERRMIRAAQSAAVAGVRRALQVIAAAHVDRSGWLVAGGRRLTSESVRCEVEITLLRHGCSARDTIIAGGRQAADPHDRGSGPLRAGETIVLDIFPQHKKSGYWGDVTRTVVKRRATPTQRAMFRAVIEAQRLALSMIRPGASVRKIHEAVQEVFSRRGFETGVKDGVARGFFHGTGHGVGLDIHEGPSISANDARLREGHVVTVEPGLYYPEHGGVRIEDTVSVTRQGFELLATCRKTFVVP
jgi:Xaa-Pro aminopeptidase